jgi:DNA replication ATP-dependent helicase Dna2
MGVISPYRIQLQGIRNKLADIPSSSAIEVHTVDKFQGRDKDCIIISLVRSNANKNVMFISILLNEVDWRVAK